MSSYADVESTNLALDDVDSTNLALDDVDRGFQTANSTNHHSVSDELAIEPASLFEFQQTFLVPVPETQTNPPFSPLGSDTVQGTLALFTPQQDGSLYSPTASSQTVSVLVTPSSDSSSCVLTPSSGYSSHALTREHSARNSQSAQGTPILTPPFLTPPILTPPILTSATLTSTISEGETYLLLAPRHGPCSRTWDLKPACYTSYRHNFATNHCVRKRAAKRLVVTTTPVLCVSTKSDRVRTMWKPRAAKNREVH